MQRTRPALIFLGFLTTVGKLQRSVTAFIESNIFLSLTSPQSPSRTFLPLESCENSLTSTENRWQLGRVHSLIFHDIYIRISVEIASLDHLNVFSYQENTHLKNVISYSPIPILLMFNNVSNGYIKVESGCSL